MARPTFEAPGASVPTPVVTAASVPAAPAPISAPPEPAGAHAPADATAPAPFAHGTLGRRLVVQVTVLVALVAILLSTATALATRTLLTSSLDQQLDGVSSRSQRADPGGNRGPKNQLLAPGQPAGSLAAAFTNDGSVSQGTIIGYDSGFDSLTPGALSALSQIPVSQGKQTAQLGSLGRYRVVGRDVTLIVDGSTTVAGRAYWGLPLEAVDRQLTQLIGLELVLTVLAMIGAVLASRAVVRRSLRPLNRVAATAQQVSQLQLDRGEVALVVRVPPADADPTSEVGRVGQAFNHMLNNVEDALAARQASETKVRQFVADASHELRNPLAAIRGYAELTRRERSSMSENAAYAMSRVEAESERMSYLVEDLLLLARLDSGPDLDVTAVDLIEVVLNAVSDARVAGPDHVWQLDVPDEPVDALGDRHRLHQVMANLLANARTHTPPGTQVRAGIAIAGDQAVLTVTDNGPGIPADIAARVFERFTRADVSRVRTPGAAAGRSTGLGLAIVAAVVEAHHGAVSVQSRPGWTQFSVSLPLAPTVPTDPARTV